MTRKRGKSRKSSADKRAFRYKRKYVIDALTKRPKILLPTWELYLRKEEVNLDFLETMLFPQFETCGVPIEDYDYYMAWVKERAKICLTFTGQTRLEEYAVLKQVFVNRGLSAAIIDCLAPTVDSWNDVMLGKSWRFNFDDGTPQGWRQAHYLCCNLSCQDMTPNAEPCVYYYGDARAHSPPYSVSFCRRKDCLVQHEFGSAYLLDLRAWLGVSVPVTLGYWFRSYYGSVSVCQFYDYDTGALLKGYNNVETLGDDVWQYFSHTDLEVILGKRVCWVYSKGNSSGSHWWDDIVLNIKGVLVK